MTIWLIYQEEDIKKNDWYIKHYIELGDQLGLTVQLVRTNDLTMVCKQGEYQLLYHQTQVELPKAAIVRSITPKLSRFLEFVGIRVFNCARISEICNDKEKTYEEIVPLNIPMVPTIGCFRSHVKDIVSNQVLPVVVKTVDGHGGQEVFLVKEIKELDEILMNTKSDFVVQPLVGEKHQDLRVYVLGKQIVKAILRTSNSEFKANFSLGGMVEAYELKKEEVKLVQKIIEHFSFDLVGIDFLIGDNGELIFNEIEDVVGARMLYQCTDIDIVWEYLLYIKQQLGE